MTIYKVLPAPAWAAFQAQGTYHGSPVDLQDGYIHLSNAAQIRGTLARHYRGQTDLRLVADQTDGLEGALRWEASRGGDRFPHLYAPLPLSNTGEVWTVHVSDAGAITCDADTGPLALSEGERFLVDWHGQKPGETARAFAALRDAEGRSSYDRLVACVRPGDRVLDLCCGDGYLLERLLDAGAGTAAGLDLSPAELGAAAARLGGRALLTQGRAQALPFPDGAFDLVTCHMAFMLLHPVEPVLQEIARVLAPGGRFAAVVGHTSRSDSAWGQLVARLLPLSFRPIQLGDPRLHTAEGARALLDGWGAVQVETIDAQAAASPAEIWAWLQGTYIPDLISAADLAALETAFWAEIAPTAAGDQLRVEHSYRLIQATRPA